MVTGHRVVLGHGAGAGDCPGPGPVPWPTVVLTLCADELGDVTCCREPGHVGVHGAMTDTGMVTW